MQCIWFESSLYRPLPASILAIVLWVVPFKFAWPLLRILNTGMIIASFWLIAKTAKYQYALNADSKPSKNFSQNILISYWIAVFMSPASLIAASWYANIFDASCLLLIAGGLLFWQQNKGYLAGGMFGLAWFCKEAAVFVLPLLMYLYAINPQLRKNTANAFFVYVALGFIYWFLRGRVVILGTPLDVHPIGFSHFFAALPSVAMRFVSPGITVMPAFLSLMITLVLALSARSLLFFSYVTALILCAAVAYQGIIGGGVLHLIRH